MIRSFLNLPACHFNFPTYPYFSSLSIPGILKKYQQFQEEYPEHLVLMQVGDFYEIYGDSVDSAAKILDIAVTRAPNKMDCSSGNPVPMTGFPVRSFDTFLGKLIKSGVSVVVADQFVLPDSNRFDRRVSRIITPGTVVEESLLDRNKHNFILFLDAGKGTCAWMDISTGDFFTTTTQNQAELVSLLARLKAREILSENSLEKFPDLNSLIKRSKTLLRILKSTKIVENLETAVSLTENEAEVAGKLLNYVQNALRGSLESIALKPISRFAPSQHFLSIDADSFRSLDIFASSVAGVTDSSATLFNTLNECQTALGSRLLARRLQAPFLNSLEITSAHDKVQKFTEMGLDSIEALQGKLAEIGDIERILQRLCLRRPQGVARDLKSLARSILSSSDALKVSSSKIGLSLKLEEHLKTLIEALNDKLPLRDADGELVRANFSKSLDDLRRLRDDSSSVFAQLASDYRTLTGIVNLRIVSFKGEQQVVEVPKAALLPSDSKFNNLFVII